MMESQRPHPKVSLEDLIRLKRAERPAPEFWAEFESQLRHKQLAAIVDKRPWWRRLSAVSLRKISLPVGATAAIAFTFVSVRDNVQPEGTTPLKENSATPLAAAPAEVLTAPEAPVTSDLVASAGSPENTYPVGATAPDPEASVSLSSTDTSSITVANTVKAASDMPVRSLLQAILGSGDPSAAPSRPQFEAAPVLASLGPSENPLATSTVSSRQLTLISSPQDARRARLLASADTMGRDDPMAGSSRAVRSRDRIASRLTEQALYDSISRLGLNADSVTIKF